MTELWAQLRPLFENDDGSLPDIFVSGLTSEQVHKIYCWVRAQSGIFSDTISPVAWDRVNNCDIEIQTIADPAGDFLAGRLESFRHGLNLFSFSGVEIPQLTVAIRESGIEFDYRMGAGWGQSQVSALFEFLWAIQRMAPNATITHGFEGASEATAEFETAWHQFRRSKPAV